MTFDHHFDPWLQSPTLTITIGGWRLYVWYSQWAIGWSDRVIWGLGLGCCWREA